ncbi:MAG: hypothetical protein AAFU55_13625, partial [Pseudomonadota bacterium]
MSDLQKRLFADMADTAQIDRAAAAARAHVGAALGRRAYPDAADIDALDELDGPLGAGTETNAILDE